jgi:HPt (histidine-containing phosphotransfer) domain-containing protein
MEGEGSSILAWERALGRLGGDRQFLSEMIGCFLVDLESELDELRRASCEGDAALVASVADAIERKAAELGADALARAAHELAGGRRDAELEAVVVEAACLRGYLQGLQERCR